MNPPGSLPIGVSQPVSTPSGLDTYRGHRVRRVWIWWHLLSLDAPTVAVAWCWFFAKVFQIALPWTALPTIAFGTWTVYVADRVLDGWRSTDTATLRDRHWFCLRYRKMFIAAWCIVSVPLAYFIFFRVPRAVRNDDIYLCLIGVAYFLLIHGRSFFGSRSATQSRWKISDWLTKELAVGFLFPIATAVPTWTRVPSEHGVLNMAILMFGGACWLNCVAIQTWEDTEASGDVVHTILASANRAGKDRKTLTALLGRHLALFSVIVGISGIAMAAILSKHTGWPLFAAVAVSGTLFFLLVRFRHRFSTLTLRIAADAVLLTPLLFLFIVR